MDNASAHAGESSTGTIRSRALTREAFCQVAPRPLRGPRTSNFDKILTWGCVRSPNRSEPSRSCVASANTALREARRTPRFGHIWQVVAGANSGERGGRHALYRPTESAISVFRPPTAQLTLKSTFTQDKKISIKVVDSGFFLGGCVQGYTL